MSYIDKIPFFLVLLTPKDFFKQNQPFYYYKTSIIFGKKM